jgi:ligand-binding sensor domain-containing protein
VVAVEADGEGGVWALSDGGVAHYHDGAWSHPQEAMPTIGAVTALAVRPGGKVWVGGTRGLLALDGNLWRRYLDDVPVAALAAPADASEGIWVGAGDGRILRVEADGEIVEHGRSGGTPCRGVRALAEGQGGLWAICSSEQGAALVRLDGERWHAFAAEEVAGAPVDLGLCGGRVLLLTEGELFRVVVGAADAEPEQRDVRLWLLGPTQDARPMRRRASPAEAQPGVGTRRAEGRPRPRAFAPIAAAAEREQSDDRSRPVLRLVDVDVRQGGRVVRCDDRGIWVGTEGLGVLRVPRRGEEQFFRTLDLLVTDRPFTVAADARARAWLLTRDQRAGVLDDAGFRGAVVEPDPVAGVEVLAFAGRGLGAYALARVRGSDVVRIYRLVDDRWSLLLSRHVELEPPLAEGEPGPGEPVAGDAGPQTSDDEMDFDFFEVDPAGRFWIGLLARSEGRPEPSRRGIVVIDRRVQDVTYHGEEPRGPGAVRIPNEVASVAFTRTGDAWMGGLAGAFLQSTDGTLRRFGEAEGVLGEIVNDVAVDHEDVPWVVTPEGIGHYRDGRWRFFIDDVPPTFNVTSIAIDSQGEVWAGSTEGAVHFDRERWETITREDGLVAGSVLSVHVDGRDRVWFVTAAGLTLLERRAPRLHPPRPSTAVSGGE